MGVGVRVLLLSSLLLILFLSPVFAKEIIIESEDIVLWPFLSPYDYTEKTDIKIDQDYSGRTFSNGWHSTENKEESFTSSKVAGENYEELRVHVYYRVLVHPNGEEEVIDSYKFDNSIATDKMEVPCKPLYFSSYKRSPFDPDYTLEIEGPIIQQCSGGVCVDVKVRSDHRRKEKVSAEGCPEFLYKVEKEIPELKINVTDFGNYTIELREIKISQATHERFPDVDYNSIIDLYESKKTLYKKYAHINLKGSITEENWTLCTSTSPEEYDKTGKLLDLEEKTFCNGLYPVSAYTKFSYHRDFYKYFFWFHYVDSPYYSGSWEGTRIENIDEDYGWIDEKVNSSVKLLDLAKTVIEYSFEIKPECPETCDDGDSNTYDYCGVSTRYKCKHTLISLPIKQGINKLPFEHKSGTVSNEKSDNQEKPMDSTPNIMATAIVGTMALSGLAAYRRVNAKVTSMPITVIPSVEPHDKEAPDRTSYTFSLPENNTPITKKIKNYLNKRGSWEDSKAYSIIPSKTYVFKPATQKHLESEISFQSSDLNIFWMDYLYYLTKEGKQNGFSLESFMVYRKARKERIRDRYNQCLQGNKIACNYVVSPSLSEELIADQLGTDDGKVEITEDILVPAVTLGASKMATKSSSKIWKKLSKLETTLKTVEKIVDSAVKSFESIKSKGKKIYNGLKKLLK